LLTRKTRSSEAALLLVTNFNKPTTIDELSVYEIFDVVDLAHCYDIAKLEEALSTPREHAELITRQSPKSPRQELRTLHSVS